ncbi:TorF family putative porin [Marinibactrum halimedae]|uniref:Histidine kinase n=1 Tax=Marinibactrum halimedae TaxID=1444977 RepID=A0AA37T8V2_9GAMM|nr:TorF family putative porin [Marinibactrum halimedae]MCD9458285.1 TorF family putative porin [Marinibactrum halimedae]GLS27088.1 hypothetical protein GCM10007877_28070 [Marinibactrum halimedae]
MNYKKKAAALVLAATSLGVNASFAEVSANVSVTNNYIWRGLTQTRNEAAVQGGIDFASDSGFYVGTWASNVSYASEDNFSYEHDIYFGFSGEAGSVSYDVGYLYYNYDDAAEFDFGEVYGSLGVGGFSATLYVLANTEAEEGDDQDFGAGEAFYASLDYGFEVGNGFEIGLHAGYHDGDFNEAFNGVPDSYVDYNFSISKGDFSFMITDTDLDDVEIDPILSDLGVVDYLDNDEMKFVVSWGMTIQ